MDDKPKDPMKNQSETQETHQDHSDHHYHYHKNPLCTSSYCNHEYLQQDNEDLPHETKTTQLEVDRLNQDLCYAELAARDNNEYCRNSIL